MKKFFGLMALAGLTACVTTHDQFIYEVTERSSDVVKVQTHKGMLNMQPEEVHRGLTHMHQMATEVCMEFGSNKSVFIRERQYTTGAYYAWVERSYRCAM